MSNLNITSPSIDTTVTRKGEKVVSPVCNGHGGGVCGPVNVTK